MNYFKRRSFLSKLFPSLALISFFPLAKTNATSTAKKGDKGKFAHIVFFWLKEPEQAGVRKKFERELNQLVEGIDVIVSSHIGTPAGTDRGVIDSSYTYNLLLTFKNKKDQDIYQEHPTHLKFIENAEHLWEKVVVYDSVSS